MLIKAYPAEPSLNPPRIRREQCARCGHIASYANSVGAFCEDCMEALADDKYESMSAEDKAEWAGFEVLEYE